MFGLTALAVELARYALDTTLERAGESLADRLVDQLLNVQNDQTRLLEELQTDVRRLGDGPWHTARLLLEQAALPGRAPADRRDYLTRSRDRLFDAVPLQPAGTLTRSAVESQLAAVLAALGEREACAMYAARAHDSAVAGLSTLLDETRRAVLLNEPTMLRRLRRRGCPYDDVFARAMKAFRPELRPLIAEGTLDASLSGSATARSIRAFHRGLAAVADAAGARARPTPATANFPASAARCSSCRSGCGAAPCRTGTTRRCGRTRAATVRSGSTCGSAGRCSRSTATRSWAGSRTPASRRT